MYQASSAFHDAVANGNKQKAMLIFDDAVFTSEDIDVETGIEFNEYFNAEEDLTMGQALSNEISFALFNDNRYLNNYGFGEFIATLGVQISTGQYIHDRTVVIETGNAKYVGMSTSPYLTRNGNALGTPPTFAVQSLLGYNGKVYAFGRNGEHKVYNDSTGADITGSNPLNTFMQHKVMKWGGNGYVYDKNTRLLKHYNGGMLYTYEFVPLGVFIADRPKVPDVLRIEFHCYDQMTKFDVDMPSAIDLGINYENTTVRALLVAMCEYLNVPYGNADIINGNIAITSEPDEFSNATARTVLKYIAEAAASNARFDRDGELVLDWVRNTGVSINESGYSEFSPYWYNTAAVDKIVNRDTSGTDDVNAGTGSNAYLIQDNPFLKGSE